MKLLIKILLMSLALNAYSYCELDQMDREMSSDRLYEIEKQNAHLELFTQSIEDALHTENIIKRLRSRPEFAQVDNKKYKALLEQEFVNDEEKIRQIAELGSHLENLLDEANYSRLKTGASIPALPVGFMIASFYINKALKNSQTLGAVRKLVELFSNHKPTISEKRENRKKVGRVTLGAIVASVVSVGVQGYEFYDIILLCSPSYLLFYVRKTII